MNKRETGNKYEDLAVEFLKNKGYTICDRNYRNRMGEIDIIATKDNTLIYIEVKYRKDNRLGEPLEAVNINKQRKICKVALYHYAYNGASYDRPVRFDVIGINGDGSIIHVENAFQFIR